MRRKEAKARGIVTTLTVPTDLRDALAKAALLAGLSSWSEYARMVLWRDVRIDARTAKGGPPRAG